jgi:hypothetical protein
MPLSDDASKTLSWLREEYIKAGYPEHFRWGFAPESGDEAAFQELAAHGYIKQYTVRKWILTELGLQVLLRPEPEGDAGVQLHHHGDVIVGAKFTTTITGSTVGAMAIGDRATASGTVTLQQGSLTQEQHRASIKDAQKALLDDEDQLDALVYETLGHFLRLAREIQVEQRALVEVHAAMTAALEQVWAQQMKPHALPQTLEVIKALAKHPAAGEVVKKLLRA